MPTSTVMPAISLTMYGPVNGIKCIDQPILGGNDLKADFSYNQFAMYHRQFNLNYLSCDKSRPVNRNQDSNSPLFLQNVNWKNDPTRAINNCNNADAYFGRLRFKYNFKRNPYQNLNLETFKVNAM